MNDDDQKYSAIQKMATSPRELIDILSDISFLPPDEYHRKIRSGGSVRASLRLDRKDASQDKSYPTSDISAEEIQECVDDLVAISQRARVDGEILWGRIQGTQYERETLDYFEGKRRPFGSLEVRRDEFPVRYPQWRPTSNSLEVLSSAHHDALTPFPSAETDEHGNVAEVIYVGNGSASELNGKI